MNKKLFISYSHRDNRYREQLATHLTSLRRQGVIADWHDRKIMPGEEWRHVIDQNLDDADFVLLLVTPDFLASDYCYGIEMQRALEKHREGRAFVIPVIVRPADWQHSPLADLHALPEDGKPVIEWASRDRAWLNVTEGIRRLADQERPIRQQITLYDSRDGGFRWSDFETERWEGAEGELSIVSSEAERRDSLVIVRHNTQGTFVTWLSKYGYMDGAPAIPVGDAAGVQRQFRLQCRVRAHQAEHTLLFTFKMDGAPMGHHLGQKRHRITPGAWIEIDDKFEFSFAAKCRVRLEDRSVSAVPSRLEIRNLVVTEC